MYLSPRKPRRALPFISMFLLLASPAQAQKIDPPQLDRYKDIRVIKLVTAHTYDARDYPGLPFGEYCKRVFAHAKVRVITTETEPFDALLHIKSRGRSLVGYYGGIQKSVPHYTGATISGDFRLEARGSTFRQRNFVGQVSPAESVARDSYLTPESAPFREALESGDMLSGLIATVNEIYGVEAGIGALKDSEAYVRRNAAKALRQSRDGRAVIPLVDVLADSDRNVRAEAVIALGELNDSRAVVPLIAAMKNPKNSRYGYTFPGVQTGWQAQRDISVLATEALGRLKDRRAIAPLIDMLRYDPTTQWAALDALEKITGRRPVKGKTFEALAQNVEAWQKWRQNNDADPVINRR